ncbi:MAG: putative sugar nucleotidyl transferase [Gemmatimonadaceae bacterium]
MTGLVLYDDAKARTFEPFALTRPLGEMRAGVELIRRRWEFALGTPAAGFIAGPDFADFEEGDAPRAVAVQQIAAGTIVANTRALPALVAQPLRPETRVWKVAGEIAAVRLQRPVERGELEGDAGGALARFSGAANGVQPLGGWWLEGPWDLVKFLSEMLADDVMRLGKLEAAQLGIAATVGTHPVFVEEGATVEPHVVLDVSAGPILVRRGASIHAFTRLVGPCAIGAGSAVLGGRVAACSVGEVCRVHGEASHTIFVGHANKAHEGFIGHSVIGRWANLGAATVNSNLKNTYGSVKLWTPAGMRDSGMQFLGALIGDHVKTGIGTRLTTGSVIGAGANVVSDGVAPKVVPPFVFGADAAAYDLQAFLGVAERAMARRQVTLGERMRRHLAAAHARRWHA